jgi:hypothetical protein
MLQIKPHSSFVVSLRAYTTVCQPPATFYISRSPCFHHLAHPPDHIQLPNDRPPTQPPTENNNRKGRELQANRRAAFTLWWEKLQRQVRVEGPVERMSEEESAAYFVSRPRGSQVGAARG